jgi:WD40 repeat protein
MYFLRSLALVVFLAAPPPTPLSAPALKHKLAGHTSTVRGAAFAPDGKTLATVGDDAQLIVWDVRSGKALITTKMGGGFGSVEYSADGKRLLTAGTDKIVRLWDARTGKETRSFAGHTQPIYVACFTPDNRYIVSTGIDGVTRVWDVATGKQVRTIPGGAHALAISPDGKYAITSGAGNNLTLWEIATGNRVRDMSGHTGVIVWLTFSPDGRTVASASYDNTVRLWETSTGKERLRMMTPNSPRVLMFSRGGRFLAEGNYDGATRIYDSGTGKELFQDKSIGQQLYGVALSPDRWYLCAGGGGGGLRLWDVSAITRKPAAAEQMTANTFADHWNRLGSDDAAEAYRAIAALSVPAAMKHLPLRFNADYRSPSNFQN